MKGGKFVILFGIFGTILAQNNQLDTDGILAQLDLESLKQAASQVPQVGGDGMSQTDDNGDSILAEIELEITEAILKAISDVEMEDSLTSSEEMDKMISSLEDERNLHDLGQAEGSGRNKRLTVDFMGMQVSYPQYLRLVKLQEKVIKLNQMIEALHSRYSAEQLNSLPQYQRLMQLHASLMPLLPEQLREANQVNSVSKRSPFSVDFLGLRVSYPQYLRLRLLQEKVIKLDQVMRQMLSIYPIEVLESNPRWNTLVSLHSSLKKVLPPEYLAQYVDAVATPLRRKRSPTTVDFNGMLVSYPQYIRLMKLQEKTLKLDQIMRKLANGRDPAMLAENPKWLELVALRQSLQKLLPADHPEFGTEVSQASKRGGATMDFNGFQVSYPQYLHLMSLREKTLKLDAAMRKISETTSQENLSKNPKWNTLVELRQSLTKLLPNEHQSVFNKKSSN